MRFVGDIDERMGAWEWVGVPGSARGPLARLPLRPVNSRFGLVFFFSSQRAEGYVFGYIP